MKTEYEMTKDSLDKLLNSMKRVPMIALQCGNHRSQQERANDAWKELGEKMGFDYMTVEPSNKGDRFFRAVSSANAKG
jgi:hypothetical protein